MNTTIPTDSAHDTPAVVDLLNHAVQGTHDTIDRLADSVAPAAQQLGASVAAAEDALYARSNQLLDARDQWVNRARTTVRRSPLTAIAVAAALGALIARITR